MTTKTKENVLLKTMIFVRFFRCTAIQLPVPALFASISCAHYKLITDYDEIVRRETPTIWSPVGVASFQDGGGRGKELVKVPLDEFFVAGALKFVLKIKAC